MIFIWKEIAEGLLPVSQRLGSSLLKQASERQIIIFKVSTGGSFSESLKTWSALPGRFSPHDLVMGGISWAGSRKKSFHLKSLENLIKDARKKNCYSHRILNKNWPKIYPAIDAFELWCWKRLLRVPWTARRSNQSSLKKISPECSLEGLMLKLKLQYFGHLMQRTDSLEKNLMLRNITGRRRG